MFSLFLHVFSVYSGFLLQSRHMQLLWFELVIINCPFESEWLSVSLFLVLCQTGDLLRVYPASLESSHQVRKGTWEFRGAAKVK